MSRFERKEKSQRKHIPSSSGAPRAPVAPPSNRPGWKGPGFVKKTARPSATPNAASTSSSTQILQEQLLPQELQQLLLNIFRDTFPASQDFDSLKPVLQEIKDALFQRDFDRAFGRDDYLEAYAVRWSPSRMLGYANVLAWICEDAGKELELVKSLVGRSNHSESKTKAVCVGGGAAEIMAFSALLRYLHPDLSGRPSTLNSPSPETAVEDLKNLNISSGEFAPRLELVLIDTADWSKVVSKLQTGLTTPPALHKYASAAARAANASFISPEAIRTTFRRGDVLETNEGSTPETTESMQSISMNNVIGPEPALITLLFTLNELYSASIAKTTAFLLDVTLAAPKDSLLLVIDSPGSYSETSIGKPKETQGDEAVEKKKHPMHWLMDYALLGKYMNPKNKEDAEKEIMWEKVIGEESRWFRLLDGLKYPVSLENMRFQVHLFRRL